MADWCTVEQARLLWADAPDDDTLLNQLLDAAQEAAEAYAPALADAAPVPARYTQAVAFHARDQWNAGQGSTVDLDGLVPVQRPMSPIVRQLLRPKAPPLGVG